MLISTEHSGFWYVFFYQMAFIAAFFTFIFICWRKKRPLAPSLLIAVSGTVFAIIGSKIGTYAWTDWEQLWMYQKLRVSPGKTTIGAFILGSLGLILAKRMLRYPYSILDSLAFAVPVALFFQRLGCLLGGCCFGTPTLLPWGVQYGDAAPACYFHYLEGHLDYPTALSLSVHPVPVYFMIAAILTFLAVHRLQNRFRAMGSLFLFSISTLFACRFLIELVRDPVTNHSLAGHFLGIKMIQWVLLGLLLINILLIYFNEKAVGQNVERPGLSKGPIINDRPSPLRSLTLALIPVTLITYGYHWFSPVELTVLRIALLLLLMLLGWQAFQQVTIPRFRLATAGLMAVAVLLMAQYPVPEEEEPQRKNSSNVGIITAPKPRKTQKITFGYLGHHINFDYIGGQSCFGVGDLHEVGPHFSTFGVDYERMWYKSSNVGLGFGAGGHLTSFQTRINGGPLTRENLGGLTAYYQMEVKEVLGFKTGLHLGDFPVINGERFDSPIMPLLYLRFGPPDRFFLDAGVGNDIPFGFSTSHFQMGGGIGLRAFGIDNSSLFRMGVTKIADQDALYFGSDLYIKQWIVSPTVRVSGSAAPNFGLKLGVQLGNAQD